MTKCAQPTQPIESLMSTGSCKLDDDRDAQLSIPLFRSCRAHSAVDEWKRKRQRTASSASTSTSRYSILDDDMDTEEMTPENDGDAVAPALPQAPYPVDQYHFYSHAHAGSIVDEITTALDELDVEYDFRALKCKFTCVKYVHYAHIEFVVRVYATEGRLLVEMQRRSGSLLLWDGLYSMIYHRLVDYIDTTAAPCPQSGGQKRVAMRDDGVTAQLWRALATAHNTPTSGVEALRIMVTSKYLDVQREGAAGVATLTQDAHNAFLVAQGELIQPLLELAHSKDQDVVRSAVAGLANVSRALDTFPASEVVQATRVLLEEAAETVMKLLVQTTEAPETLFTVELLRELTRALQALSTLCPAKVGQSAALGPLRRHVNHRDEQLAALCREVLHQVQVDIQ